MAGTLPYQVSITVSGCVFHSCLFLPFTMCCFVWLSFQQDTSSKAGDLRHRNFCAFHKLSPFFQLKLLDEFLTTSLHPTQFSDRIQFYRCLAVSFPSCNLATFPFAKIFA